MALRARRRRIAAPAKSRLMASASRTGRSSPVNGSDAPDPEFDVSVPLLGDPLTNLVIAVADSGLE
jgi:hypothetical protein